MTVEQIARIVHEANRAYCEATGDYSQRAYDASPGWQKESARAGVEGVLSGKITMPEQAHDSWLAQKEKDGWTFGSVKDADKKEHPCMVPYDSLPAAQRVKDALFFGIVNALAPEVDF